MTCCMCKGNASCINNDAILAAVDSSFIDNTL